MTLFSNASGDRWTVAASHWSGSASIEALGVVWRLNVTHTQPSGDLRIRPPGRLDQTGKSCFSARIAFLEATTKCRLSIAFLDERLTLDGQFGCRSADWDDFTLGVRVEPFSLLQARIQRASLRLDPAATELYYMFADEAGGRDQVGGSVRWSIPARVTQVDLTVRPTPALGLHSRLVSASMPHVTPHTLGGSSDDFSAAIGGEVLFNTTEMRYTLTPLLQMWVSAQQVRLRAQLTGYEGRERFAHFGIVRADVNRHTFGFRYRRCFLSAGYGWGHGALKGSMEIWPFVDGLVRLLGERRHIVVEGSAKWIEVAFRGLVINRSKYRTMLSVHWLRLHPELASSTWRPVAFGFGIADRCSSRLDLIRADLLRLGVTPAFRIGAVMVQVDLSQWLPIGLRRDNGAGVSNDSDIGGGSAQDRRSRTTGGLSIAATLTVGV